MKKLLFLAFFVLPAFLFAQEKVALQGQINNPVSDHLLLSFQNHFVTYAPKTIEIPLKKDNTFFVEIDIDSLSHVYLQHGNQVTDLFLQVWDSVNIKADGRNFQKTITFKGLGASENNCLTIFHQKFDKKNSPYPQKYKTLNPKNFRSFVDKNRKEESRFLKNYSREYTLSEDFVSYLQNKIDYTWANHLMKYPLYFTYLNQGTEQKYSNSYYDFLKQIDIENQTALINYEYVRFLDNYFDYLSKKRHANTQLKRYDLIKNKLKGSVGYHTLARFLATAIDNSTTNSFEELEQEYKKLSRSLAFNNYHYLELLENKLSLKSELKSIQGLANFELHDLKRERVNLNKFKNQDVCLIFWQTDCKNCQNQSQIANQLLEDNGADFEMIYVALDEDEDFWIDQVSEQKIAGVQLYAGKSANKIIKKYDLSKLPSYFLINKKGEIIQKSTGIPTKEDINLLVD